MFGRRSLLFHVWVPFTGGSHDQFFLEASLDAAGGESDFASDEGFATSWRFVVEEDPGAGVHVVRLAVVDRLPVSVKLGASVRTSRVKRSGRALRGRGRSKHLGT